MRRSLRNSAALLALVLVCPGCDIQFEDCNGDGFVTWDEIEATLMGDSCSGGVDPSNGQPPESSAPDDSGPIPDDPSISPTADGSGV